MNRIFKGFLVPVGLLLSVSAFAHPGHGSFTGHELWHYLTSPIHIGVALGAVVIIIAGYKVFKAQRSSTTRK